MNIDRHYRRPFIFAFSLHVLLFIFLLMHFTAKRVSLAPVNNVSAINATAVSQSQLQQQLDEVKAAQQIALKQQEEQKQQQVLAAQQKLQQQEQQEQEQKEQQQLQQQKAQQEKLQQEQEVQLKIQQAQMQQEQAVKEQHDKQVAAQKAAAEAKAAQLEAAKLATQKLLQQEISAAANAPDTAPTKQKAQTAAAAAASAGEIDKYKALIIQAISQQWIMPEDPQNTQNGKLLVEVAPGGMVISVQITQSSGDDALDRSARNAVLKASPLPVPADPALFNRFRELNLTVQPQGILTSG